MMAVRKISQQALRTGSPDVIEGNRGWLLLREGGPCPGKEGG
jgi:hypothetical protein